MSRRLIDAIDRYIQKADDELSDTLKNEGFVENDKTVDKINEIEEQVANVLSDEADEFLEAINEAVDLETISNELWPQLKLDDQLALQIATIFKEQFNDCMPWMIKAYLKQLDEGLEYISITKRTMQWIDDWSEELGDLMQLTSHNQLENILLQNLEEKKGVQQFVNDIMESGIRDSYYRARRVALTETLRAHSVSQEESIQQSPSVISKEWIHTGNHRNNPRENHVAMNGQIVDKKDTFTLTGSDGIIYEPKYPRDGILPASESIHCHCIHRGIVDEEIIGMPLTDRQQLQRTAIDEMDDEWEKELDQKNRAKADI